MHHHKPRTAARRYLDALRTENREIMFSREIDALFEMGDGDEVVIAIMTAASDRDKRLMLEYNGKQNFDEWTALCARQQEFCFSY